MPIKFAATIKEALGIAPQISKRWKIEMGSQHGPPLGYTYKLVDLYDLRRYKLLESTLIALWITEFSHRLNGAHIQQKKEEKERK